MRPLSAPSSALSPRCRPRRTRHRQPKCRRSAPPCPFHRSWWCLWTDCRIPASRRSRKHRIRPKCPTWTFRPCRSTWRQESPTGKPKATIRKPHPDRPGPSYRSSPPAATRPRCRSSRTGHPSAERWAPERRPRPPTTRHRWNPRRRRPGRPSRRPVPRADRRWARRRCPGPRVSSRRFLSAGSGWPRRRSARTPGRRTAPTPPGTAAGRRSTRCRCSGSRRHRSRTRRPGPSSRRRPRGRRWRRGGGSRWRSRSLRRRRPGREPGGAAVTTVPGEHATTFHETTGTARR